MIWSTMYRMANIARISPTSSPAIGAAMRPIHRLSVRLATTAERNAPASNCPSIAMLMTPARSQSTPESAPNTSGTARNTEPRNSPVKEMVLPAMAHTRNASSHRTANPIVTHSGICSRRETRSAANPARARQITDNTMAVVRVGSATGLIWNTSAPKVMPNVLVCPESEPKPNTTNASTPKTASAIGTRQVGGRSTTASGSGAAAGTWDGRVAVLTRSIPSTPASLQPPAP